MDQWAIYQALDSESKKSFFEKVAPVANTLHAHFGSREKALTLSFNQEVVDVIIGQLFFNADDPNEVSRLRAISLFDLHISDSEARAGYATTIKNVLQFRLVVKYLSHGLSFSQIAAVLLSTKQLTGVGAIGSVSHTTVSNFARIIVAANLSIMHDILESPEVFAYSIALDSSTHRAFSYLAIRVRFHFKDRLHNLHVAAVPMFEKHTAVNIFNLTVRVLDALCPAWRAKLIGIASDGANVMTGRIGGVVTLLEKELQFPVHRTWCLLHQIDLVAKSCLNALFDGQFMTIVNKIANSLRKQETLIREMGGKKCPKLTTRWLAMGTWTHWQLQNYEQLEAFFETRRNHQIKPSEWYWPVVAAVYGLFDRINISITSLQSRNLLMTEQESEVHRLISTLKEMTDAEDHLNAEGMENLPGIFSVGSWTISSESVTGFLDDQGMVTHELMNSLPNDVRVAVIAEVGELIVGILDGISRICTTRDSENKPIEEQFPSLMPAFLAKVRGRDFLPLVQRYRDRFAGTLNQITLEQIQLFKSYQTESALQIALDQLNDSSFEKNWAVVKGRFPALRSFAGALYTVFPNTSSVESDFSVLGWEKDEHRESLSNLSLEGILQAKQFDHLHNDI